MEQPANMIDVVAHTELAADQGRDPRTGPQVGGVAVRLGTAQKLPLESLAGSQFQLRRAARGRLGGKARLPLLVEARSPATHRSAVHPQLASDLHRQQTI